jgi:thiol:disulfide interchange protein
MSRRPITLPAHAVWRYRWRMRPLRTAWLPVLLSVLVACAAMPAQAAERDIYPAPERAKSDLTEGLAQAAAGHKRVILDFGGNWCPDCHVLDLYFHDATNKPILEANYVLVHVNIGRMTDNLDIAERYQVPLRKGVPALAVLDEHGGLLFSQKTGEFEAMRGMQSSAVTDFLLRWKSAPG